MDVTKPRPLKKKEEGQRSWLGMARGLE